MHLEINMFQRYLTPLKGFPHFWDRITASWLIITTKAITQKPPTENFGRRPVSSPSCLHNLAACSNRTQRRLTQSKLAVLPHCSPERAFCPRPQERARSLVNRSTFWLTQLKSSGSLVSRRFILSFLSSSLLAIRAPASHL